MEAQTGDRFNVRPNLRYGEEETAISKNSVCDANLYVQQEDTLVEMAIATAALGSGQSREAICKLQRGSAPVARARQIAAYLMHTTLSMSLTSVAERLCKDRTTIGYACRLIEDMRDDEAFDLKMVELENAMYLAKELATNG